MFVVVQVQFKQSERTVVSTAELERCVYLNTKCSHLFPGPAQFSATQNGRAVKTINRYYECKGLEISSSPKYVNMVLDKIYRLFFDPLIIYTLLIIRWNTQS